jgi:response regulator RpfG family c-di-GMP phosphodiesterase
MNNVVLLVDDEPGVLRGYQRNIEGMFESEAVSDPLEALARLKAADKYALILSDYRMPGMTGVELLRKASEIRPNTVRMLITGYADVKTSMEAINEGSVFRMLSKPCDTNSFYKAIESGLRQHELITSEHELLEKTLNGSIQVLNDIMSVLDHDAFGRGRRIAFAAKAIAQALKAKSPWEIEVACALAEVGRVTLPADVSNKRIGFSELDGPSIKLLTRLPEFSSKLLSMIPRLEGVSQSVLYQNKNFDGSGFPEDKLHGEFIPLGARILRVVNDIVLEVDKGREVPEIIEGMLLVKGQYDPAVLGACQTIMSELSGILSRTAEDEARSYVKVSELREGSRLCSHIQSAEGMVIAHEGTIVTPAVLQRVRNFATIMKIREPIEIIPPKT